MVGASHDIAFEPVRITVCWQAGSGPWSWIAGGGANVLVKVAGKPVDDGPAWGLPRDSGLQARDEEFDFGLEVGRETDSDGEKCEQYTHKYSTYRLHSMITSEFGLAAQEI